jgi:hypothetical protein
VATASTLQRDRRRAEELGQRAAESFRGIAIAAAIQKHGWGLLAAAIANGESAAIHEGVADVPVAALAVGVMETAECAPVASFALRRLLTELLEAREGQPN